ncbi:hypothetical protein B4U79_18751 [Dinothrombium tinctorium]|uniref:Ig-like domain-containing protein n=1 Tax=Dinothrombium tinctorium TaxID=1965070 RepID=A0A443Q9M8_9ACAR|nr:hypothetical protein B4U79_18751 [Dinothrombium tinctorium]
MCVFNAEQSNEISENDYGTILFWNFLELEISFPPHTRLGEELIAYVIMRNNLEERLKYNIDLLAHSIYNNGQKYRDLYHCRQIVEIEPSTEIWTRLELQPKQYIRKLATFATVEFQAFVTELDDGKLVAFKIEKVSLENPKMKLTWYLSEDGSALNINAIFKNPLDVTLTNCKLKISGTRMHTRQEYEYQCSNERNVKT